MESGPFDLGGSGADTSVAPKRNFPQSKDLFANDDRVSYDQTNEKWILEDHDGSQWEYHERAQRWTSLVDELDIERFQASYVYKGNDTDSTLSKKRKNSDDLGAQTKRTRNGRDASEEPTNAAIYLKNLPPDTDERELATFAAVAGLIEDDLNTGQPRVKLYRDKQGQLKGDGLVYYHKPQSVYLALDVLDGRAYRANRPFENEIEVSEADFKAYKKAKKEAKEKKAKGEKSPTEQEAPHLSATDWKRALQKSKTKLNSMLADWGDEDPSAILDPDTRDFKFVLLFNMFTLDELVANPKLVDTIRKQTSKRCKKYGEVQKVVVFDQEPRGIVRIRFKTPESAQACTAALHRKLKYGPAGAETVVEARLSDGQENFRKLRAPQKQGMQKKMSVDSPEQQGAEMGTPENAGTPEDNNDDEDTTTGVQGADIPHKQTMQLPAMERKSESDEQADGKEASGDEIDG